MPASLLGASIIVIIIVGSMYMYSMPNPTTMQRMIMLLVAGTCSAQVSP